MNEHWKGRLVASVAGREVWSTAVDAWFPRMPTSTSTLVGSRMVEGEVIASPRWVIRVPLLFGAKVTVAFDLTFTGRKEFFRCQ